jgi:hypothetical protein
LIKSLWCEKIIFKVQLMCSLRQNLSYIKIQNSFISHLNSRCPTIETLADTKLKKVFLPKLILRLAIGLC